jgi:O-acetyl-ADP-ribose deacetylase (regulator of RNase III)
LYPDGLPTGEAISTTGGNLAAKRVIHTVGPVWHGGDEDEPTQLANAYRNCLIQARHETLRTLAFPSISTGAYGFPIGQAASIALKTVSAYLSTNRQLFDEIRFVLFSKEDFNIYERTAQAFLKELGAENGETP